MMLEFTEEGLLPPGTHETNLAEVREKMGWSRGRRRLIDGLQKALELMADCGVHRVYLDGSFVTDKNRPQDIDGCYDPDEGATIESLESMSPIFPPSMQNRVKAREAFGVDFFPAAATELGSG